MCVRVRVRGCNISKYSGSTVDAMSDAIEGADVMLYGVSLKYKESANVRIAHTRTAAASWLQSRSAGQVLGLT